jgi:hypothetical protein
MRFKWDSSVARDIAVDMDRLEQGTEDCVSEIHRGIEVLQQMQGGDMSRVIDKYISAADTLVRKLRSIADAFGDTGLGIKRADELFDSLEAQLNGRAQNMGGETSAPSHGAQDTVWSGMDQGGVAPIFYNLPGAATAPVGPTRSYITRHEFWPTLSGISRTVVVDQVSLNADMVTPQWLQDIIDEA